jgi:hypothetical protein
VGIPTCFMNLHSSFHLFDSTSLLSVQGCTAASLSCTSPQPQQRSLHEHNTTSSPFPKKKEGPPKTATPPACASHYFERTEATHKIRPNAACPQMGSQDETRTLATVAGGDLVPAHTSGNTRTVDSILVRCVRWLNRFGHTAALYSAACPSLLLLSYQNSDF